MDRTRDDDSAESTGEPPDSVAVDGSEGGELDIEFRVTRAAALHQLFGGTLEPVRLGRYTVLDTLGEGSMGTVYLAEDPELGRKLAIKLVRTDETRSNSRQRFLREARALAMLNHQNVVTIHDVGEHRGQAFIAMEYVKGRTVAAWQAAEERTLGEVLDVYVAAGRGLAAAHDKGLVHRDFKPANVLVADDGRIVVVDFGLARKADDAETAIDLADEAVMDRSNPLHLSLTRTGARVGTPAYMSPEQLRGEIPDARGDQFSFCAALYEGLYRRRPFAGGTLTELTALVRRGTLEPPPADAAVPSSIWRVLERGLQIDERDRFASMDELLEALDAARKPTGARPRTGPLRAGIGAVGVLGALGAVWFGLTRPDPPEEASALQPLAALADPTMASPSGESAAAPELPGPEVSVSPEKPAAQRFDLGSATEEIAEVAGEEVAPARRRRKRSTPRVERMRPPSPLTRADMLAKLRKRAAACEGNVGHRVQFQVLTTGGTAAVRVVPKNPCIHAAVRSATFPAGQRVDALSFDVAATRSDRQPEDPPGSE